MIINTTAGKTYAVTPQTDCTVSTPDGVLIATCPAGGQTFFVAPSAEVEVSDNAALVTESFKGAPAGLSAVWGPADLWRNTVKYEDLPGTAEERATWGMYGWCNTIAAAAGGKDKPVQVIIPAILCARLLSQLKITEMNGEESKACFRGAVMGGHFSGELVVQGIMTDAYSTPQFFRSYQITYSKGGYIWTTPSCEPYFNFEGDFSGVTITKNLFRSELYLDEVHGIMPDVTDATMMCTSSSIKEWYVDLPSLVVAGSGMSGVFQNCKRLEKFTGALPMLEKGNAHATGRAGMFYACPALTDFQSQLPVLSDGRSMFQSCSSLSSWSIPLPVLSLGNTMFYATALAEWTVPLPSLSNGNLMFCECRNLSTITTTLPLLKSALSMFRNCIFRTFDIPLPCLEEGTAMFNGCRNLSTFDSSIPLLRDADDMFLNCGLDVGAINSILDRLPVYEDGQDHTITFTGCLGATGCNTAIGTAKGWTVEV